MLVVQVGKKQRYFLPLTSLTSILTSTLYLPNHLPLYLTHLLTYLYKQASSVSSIRVSVRGLCMLVVVVLIKEASFINTTTTNIHRPLTLTLILDTLLACLYKQVSKCVKYKGKWLGRYRVEVSIEVSDVSGKKQRYFLPTYTTNINS